MIEYRRRQPARTGLQAEGRDCLQRARRDLETWTKTDRSERGTLTRGFCNSATIARIDRRTREKRAYRARTVHSVETSRVDTSCVGWKRQRGHRAVITIIIVTSYLPLPSSILHYARGVCRFNIRYDIWRSLAFRNSHIDGIKVTIITCNDVLYPFSPPGWNCLGRIHGRWVGRGRERKKQKESILNKYIYLYICVYVWHGYKYLPRPW